MDLLAAIKREERKLERELGKLQHQLSGVRAAAKALGATTVREVTQVKKRVMSDAVRAKISSNKSAVGKIQSREEQEGKGCVTGSKRVRLASGWCLEPVDDSTPGGCL